MKIAKFVRTTFFNRTLVVASRRIKSRKNDERNQRNNEKNDVEFIPLKANNNKGYSNKGFKGTFRNLVKHNIYEASFYENS